MRRDVHAGKGGRYQVVSLYFDNADDRALRQKIDGVGRREKFRLRYYGADAGHILLEKKQKVNGLCLKISEPITAESCRRLPDGRSDWMAPSTPSLHQELYVKMGSRMFRPKTVS